jgi:hypothetical protein
MPDLSPASPVGWRGLESRQSHTSPSAWAGAVYAPGHSRASGRNRAR